MKVTANEVSDKVTEKRQLETIGAPEELLTQLDRLARFPLARKPSHIHSH